MEPRDQQTAAKPVPWSIVALLVVILISCLFSLALALVNFVQGTILLIQGDSESATAILIIAAGSLARLLLLSPGGYYALMRLLGRKPRHLALEAVPSWAIMVAWLGVVTFGALVIRFDFAAPLFIPPLSAMVSLLPVWLIARLAIRRLGTGSDLRRWGSFSLGTTAGPFLSTILEAAFLIGLIILMMLVLVGSPGLRDDLLRLATRLQSTSSEEAMLQMLIPLLLDRRVVFVIILTLCVITPIIEEALKPIAVWFGAGRILTPAQGFAIGALCGAGFAAFESLMATASAGMDWTSIVVLRAGTDVMHTANAALMGWALVMAWRGRGYLRLALIYVGVIMVHGTWNLVALSYGLSNLPAAFEGIATDLKFQAPYALPALAVIALSMLCVLIFMNRRLSAPAYIGLATAEADAADTDLQV